MNDAVDVDRFQERISGKINDSFELFPFVQQLSFSRYSLASLSDHKATE